MMYKTRLTANHVLLLGLYNSYGSNLTDFKALAEMANAKTLDWIAWIADDSGSQERIIWTQVVGEDVFNVAFQLNAYRGGAVFLKEVAGVENVLPADWTK